MTLDADAVVERRRLKRRVTVLARSSRAGDSGGGGSAVRARAAGAVGETLGLGGTCRAREDQRLHLRRSAQQKLLRKHCEEQRGQSRYRADQQSRRQHGGRRGSLHGVARNSGKKPVVAVFATTATSAAYMAAIAADHIVARANSITGSVGVIVQWARGHRIAEECRRRFNQIKSGDLKAVPFPFEPDDRAPARSHARGSGKQLHAGLWRKSRNGGI